MTAHATPFPAAARRGSSITDTFNALRRPVGVTPALPARRVQELLIAHDLLDRADLSCRYDRQTLNAVARFQARYGLTVDGLPGHVTCDALLA